MAFGQSFCGVARPILGRAPCCALAFGQSFCGVARPILGRAPWALGRLCAGRFQGPLKLFPGPSDLSDMGLVELNCPICDADFALGGDEKPGDEVFCSFCGSPCRLTGDPYDEECEIEEDI